MPQCDFNKVFNQIKFIDTLEKTVNRLETINCFQKNLHSSQTFNRALNPSLSKCYSNIIKRHLPDRFDKSEQFLATKASSNYYRVFV